ncbi:autotransporter-associated beta strand repeat-containing protein, partial [Herbaspirillum sp. Sphag1AN]|uniref:autotransporter-associated beta strand repeat-containing protein n=1 Tax=unclassified Herbaspirillum TaxID=2624150 RepID=UPI00351C9019
MYDGGSSLTLNPTGTGKILFYDPISAVLGSTITKTGDGEVIFDGNAGATGYNSPVSGNTTVQAGTFSLVNQDTYGATAGTFSVNSGGTVSGSNGSALQPATIIINNGGTLNVAGGIFNLGAPSMTMAAGSLLTGNGTLNSIYNINLGAGAAGVIANIDDGDILTENARLAGTGGLTKQGGGTLVLGAVNTYTGATTISGGTVQTGVANAIQASSAVSVETGATLDMSQFAQTINNLSGAGTVLLGTQTLTANNATAASEFSGVISGSGGLTKIGTNTLTLSGDNTYTGTITISAGTLQIGNNGDTGSVAGNITDNGTLIFNRSNDASYGGIITGSGVLNQNGTGQLTLSNDASSVGSVNVNSGILNLAQTGNFTVTGNYTTANNATTVVGGNATLTVNGSFTQQANSTLNATAGSAPVINVTNATLGGTLNVDGVASDITADKASALGSVTYKLINATGTISNNFSTINFAGVSSPLDYIAPTGYVGDSNHSYYVSLGLAWMAAASQSNGVFTLPNVGDTFDVDVVLGDQAQGTTSGWDGKTLTKQGAGTLI